ncbi:hypothetical protein L5515_003173 [Caenorhabditis briggsae]|uniref:Uncharacterized protein n=1 Tax=Caenorhabditis briggsae TaxID=6238 RepID=A0AAE9EIH2_CAEBR|nr:hypothetical protein L5515_003173 [Caenorhabditis briggsae]
MGNPFPFLQMTTVSQRQMIRLFNFHEQICYALISKKSAEFVKSLNLKVKAFSIEFLSPKRIEITIGDWGKNTTIRTNLIDYWGTGHSIIQFPMNNPPRWIYLNIGILEFLKLLSEIYHCKFLNYHFGNSKLWLPMEIIEKLSNGFQVDTLAITNKLKDIRRILKYHLPVNDLSILVIFSSTVCQQRLPPNFAQKVPKVRSKDGGAPNSVAPQVENMNFYTLSNAKFNFLFTQLFFNVLR